jgi:hypothetical protein
VEAEKIHNRNNGSGVAMEIDISKHQEDNHATDYASHPREFDSMIVSLPFLVLCQHHYYGCKKLHPLSVIMQPVVRRENFNFSQVNFYTMNCQ